MTKSITSLLLIFVFSISIRAQHLNPSVVYQSGFSMNASLNFEILKGNEFLMGYTELGEYIFWDLKSNKIVKKIKAVRDGLTNLLFIPTHSVSNDGKKILIPQQINGGFYIYDLYTNDIPHVFFPQKFNEKFLYAFFKDDGYLILSQNTDRMEALKILEYDTNFLQTKSFSIELPEIIKDEEIKLLTTTLVNSITQVPYLHKAAWDNETGKLYISTTSNELFSIELNLLSKTSVNKIDSKFSILPYFEYSFENPIKRVRELSVLNGKLIAKFPIYVNRNRHKKNKTGTLKQKIIILNPEYKLIEKTVESTLPILDTAYYSIGIGFLYNLSNHSNSIYYEEITNSKTDFEFAIKDLFSDQELGRYKSGKRKIWSDTTPYLPGQLNGGQVIDVSSDKKYMIELSRDIVIHDLTNKSIKSILTTQGNYRLNAPLFINNSTILIPKITTDGFIFNMESGKVDLLKNNYECLDTIRNGAASKWQMDNDILLGMKNFSLSPDEKYIVGVDFFNDSICIGKPQKKIILYDKNTLQAQHTYFYEDELHTWYSAMLPGEPHSFLINNKLIKFENPQTPTILNLNLDEKKKKNIYWAHNPVYLKNENKIFSILGTRESPGKKEVFFAFYDLNGKLLEKIEYKRPNNGQEFKTLITDSKLSEDESKLLFTFFDGTGGIFDIKSRKVVFNFEHGIGINPSLFHKKIHTAIASATFVDDESFVTSGSDGMLYLWKINKNSSMAEINNYPVILYDLQISPDKKYLIGVDYDKTVKFFDLEMGKNVADFVAIDSKTHAVIDKDGYYMTNKYTNDGLWFFSNGKTYEISQFDVRLNRPDKVLKSLGYAPEENINFFNNAYKKRIEHLGIKDPELTDSYLNMSIPEITEIKGIPQNLQDFDQEKLGLSIRSESKKDKIDRIFVTVNGVPIYGTKGKNLDTKQVQSGEIPVNIPIVPGKNSITISVMNAAGVESERSFLNINRKSDGAKPNLHLIAIGAGKFKQNKKNLEFPAKDAQDIVELFSKSDRFGKVTTKIFTDEKVNKKSILSLKEELKKVKPEDFVIIFYAGHGMLDKDLKYYLSTYTTDFKNNVNTNSISYQDLEGLMDGIPSLNKIIFIDACFSGEIDKSSAELETEARTTTTDPNADGKFRSSSYFTVRPTNMYNSFELMQTTFSDLRMNTGTTVIASSRGFEKSLEFYGLQNGAFTYSLINGLSEKKADSDGDSSVTVSELLHYLRTEVPYITNGDQTPISRAENFSNNFIIWK